MASKSKRAASAIRSRQTKSQGRGQQQHAIPFYSDVVGLAGSLFRSKQDAGAERISSLAGAARNIAAELPDVPQVQTYVAAAADQIDKLAVYVADNSLEQIIEDGTTFARRYPVSTLAFAIAAGYGFTRLMAKPNYAGRPAKRAASASTATAKRAKANGSDRSHESVNVH